MKYKNTTTGQLIFYYLHSSLFEDVQHLSAFMCKNIVSKEGEDLSERFAITDDEEGMFQICLREALPDIYEAVKPLTHGIGNAIADSMSNTALAALGVTNPPAGNYVVIVLQDNGAYNPNDLTLVDSALQSAIEEASLAQFYARVTHPDLTKLSAAQAMSKEEDVARRIVPLRKKSIL